MNNPRNMTQKPLFVAATATGAAEIQALNQADSGEGLRQKTQNPVSDLIRVLPKNNFDFGIGPNDATRRWLEVFRGWTASGN
jgi:hypothetical protein